MAYTPQSALKQEEEDGTPQAPGATTAPSVAAPSLGSTPSFGGTAGNVGSGGLGAQSDGTSKPQSAGAGTGFVNIDKVLQANKNAGEQLKASSGETKAKEEGAFNGGFDATMAGIKSQTAGITDPGVLLNNLNTPTDKYATNTVHHKEQKIGEGYGPNDFTEWDTTEKVQTAPDDRSAAIKAAQDALARTYAGPNGLDYDVGNTENAQLLRGMGNVQSTGAALAAKAGPLANYNTGLSAIDQAIFGSADVQPAVQDVAAGNAAMFADQAKRKGDVATAATDAKTAIDKNVADTRSTLQGWSKQLSPGVTMDAHTNTTLDAISSALGDPSLGAAGWAAGNPPKAPTLPPPPAQSNTEQAQPAAKQEERGGAGFAGQDLETYKRMRELGWSEDEARAQVLRGQDAFHTQQLPGWSYDDRNP